MCAAFDLTIDPEGIAQLIFDLPGESINKLSLAVMEELESVLEQLEEKKQAKALVIRSAKSAVFIAGADLKSFQKVLNDPSLAEKMIQTGHRIYNKLQNLHFPSIAAINGACLGGGLELALACTYRIVADSQHTSLGLPETSLGLFPGWGGTQRLPRLVGLTQGLTMILSAKPVDAKKAYQMKLVDAIFPYEFFQEGIERFVSECLSKKGRNRILERRKRSGVYSFVFEKNPLGRAVIYRKAKKNVLKKTKGFYPAPLAAIEVVRGTYALPLKKGLEEEIKYFLNSMTNGDFCHVNNLVQLFFNSEAIKKNPGIPETSMSIPTIDSAGVIGAGTMGSGIAWLLSDRGLLVRMKDIHWKAIGKGYAAAWKTYQTLIKKKKLQPSQVNAKFHKISGTISYQGFEHVAFVIEAAVENIELKHKILQELEENISSGTIVASNTSSYTVAELSSVLKHPERLVGMHFFNPPARMPLVEIVPGEKTAPEVIVSVVRLCKSLKKIPIVVRDCAGFLVNRLFVRGFFEVLLMLEEGVPMERLDRAFLNFGMPMAPFLVADEVGNDVNLNVFESLTKAYGDRFAVPEVLKLLNQQGLFGKKAGKGFYVHKKKPPKPNPQIKELVVKSRQSERLTEEKIVDRLTLAMINEASRCLEEGIVQQPGHLDVAMVFGTGFPPFRGGLLKYADHLGIETLVSRMENLQAMYGERYTPTKQLREMQKRKETFY